MRHPALKLLFVLLQVALIFSARAATTVQAPPDIDHAPWSELLKKYVDDRGMVDYAAWKGSPDDRRALERYLGAFARSGAPAASREAEIAALINAYNAFTIQWILQNHPTPSIRETSDSWDGARWNIGGRKVSLDEIEHKNLRPLYGWKVHGTIVCAARSCPPLQREAFTAENLDMLTARAFRAWLDREDLNHYEPGQDRVLVSAIFKWFKEDFTGDGALPKVLQRFGPEKYRDFLVAGEFEVEYLDYHWGLNDQGGLGEDYKPGASALFKSIF
ncbi:MAG: DUF547 domain-containing protein [Opitutaceae bacterium]